MCRMDGASASSSWVKPYRYSSKATNMAFPTAMFVAFDEYLYGFTQELLAEAPSILLIQLKQAFAAGFLDLFFDVSFHTRCGCALSWREAEDVRFGKLQFCGKLVGLLKIVIALAWETGDNIRADGDTRDKSLSRRDDALVTGAVIATCHTPQYVIRPTLHG